MPGETAEKQSGWTVDTLSAHFAQMIDEHDRRYEQRFVAQEKAVADAFLAAEKAVQAALTAQKEAVNKAEAAAEKRFESVNEFRSQLGDQAATFLPRNEYLAQHQALIDKVVAGDEALGGRLDGAVKALQDTIARNGELIAALGIRIERSEGQRTGLKDGWGYLVGAAGFIATVIAIVFALIK